MMANITMCYKPALCPPEWLISESFNGIVIWKANLKNRGLCVKCDMIKSAVVQNKLQSKVKHKDIKNPIDCAGFVVWLKPHLIQTSFIETLCVPTTSSMWPVCVCNLRSHIVMSNITEWDGCFNERTTVHCFMHVLSQNPSQHTSQCYYYDEPFTLSLSLSSVSVWSYFYLTRHLSTPSFIGIVGSMLIHYNAI